MDAPSFNVRLRAVARSRSIKTALLRTIVDANVDPKQPVEEQGRLRTLILDKIESGEWHARHAAGEPRSSRTK